MLRHVAIERFRGFTKLEADLSPVSLLLAPNSYGKNSVPAASKHHLSQRLAQVLAGKEPIAISIPAFYGVVREEPYVNDARLERLLGAGEQGSVVRNLVARLGGLKELGDLLRLSVGAEIVH